MFKRLTRLLGLLLCLGTAAVNADNTDWEIERVLVLHSYEPSYQWTSDIQKGIEEGFKQTNSEVKLSIEYLDAKRVHTDGYFRRMANYLKLKYKDYEFDGVIISDDAALQFAKRYLANDERFTPLVAVGINDADATLDTLSSSGSVLYEQDRVAENLLLINQLRPQIKNLYYLADRSMTSELIHERVVAEMKKFPQINLIELRDETLDDASKQLENISPNDAVLLTHFNTEAEQGHYHSYQQVAHVIGAKSAAPVFVLWEMYLEEPGILGGFVNRSEQYGYEAAELMAGKLGLSMTKVDDELISEAVLDFTAIQKYGISRYDIPESAHIINAPPPAIQVNIKLLLFACALIILLFLVIVSQFMTMRQRKVIDQKNRKIVTLQKRTLSVQKEMIHILGEAIECRSGETGQHVKRVARLSATLAEFYGLSHREVEMIEVISPMHDVGKISVPESILDKKGKLDADEWEIMKRHTTKGFELLNNREGEITKLAAIVAHEHHERWDGTGYPNGLKGEDIHLFARIVAIADVFDALFTERCYKRAWTTEEVVELFRQEKGKHFDPVLTQLLLNNLDDFIEVRYLYPDNEV
ncbi:HD domain-containing protein [Vibrio harveyi]|uniref:HD domain-containing phosphohydrolase n=1 Tax=Vibrio harveyi TaxID=669 RepID=UPI00215BBBC2|nr:HD domain-containing phosphohydrolase [Vibrio harveyi]MCR9771892.1 HD domain-containing protein [Vibrio harveyi]